MRIMRLKEVMDTTGLGRSYIYKLIAGGSLTRWNPGFWRELERGIRWGDVFGNAIALTHVMRLHYHLPVIPHRAGGGHGHP